jgi:hypothetical protein
VNGNPSSPVEYAVRILSPDNQAKLLADHSGVRRFSSRDHAERMTHRLAFNNTGDLYEIVELPR